MADKKLKSSYELAMERLSRKDPGMAETILSDDVKARIAEIRSEYEVKIAEREIMFRSKMKELDRDFVGPELMLRRSEFENEYKNTIAVLKTARDTKINKVRNEE